MRKNGQTDRHNAANRHILLYVRKCLQNKTKSNRIHHAGLSQRMNHATDTHVNVMRMT